MKRTTLTTISLLAFIPLVSCVAEDGIERDPDDNVLATIEYGNGSEMSFIALADADGVVRDVGVLEHAIAGSASASVEASQLNALELFNALTAEDVEPPAELTDLYEDEQDRARGWLLDDLESTVSPRYSCSNSWFLDRHGTSQTTYATHPGPNSGAWTNDSVTSSDPWTYQRNNIDKVKMGACHQSGSEAELTFKYRITSTWYTAYEEVAFTDGEYYWWYCNTCTNYDWKEEIYTLGSATMDVGYDYTQ